MGAASGPREHEVDLWLADLRGLTVVASEVLGHLSPGELRRYDRIVFMRDRRSFLVRGLATRSVLASYLRVGPRQVRFSYGAWGKPHVAGEPRLAFNTSHSSDRMVIAVAGGGPIGVDLERIRAIPDLPGLLRACCSPDEAAAIIAEPPGPRLEAFFRCWTRREAYLKALGTGLGRSVPAHPLPQPAGVRPQAEGLAHDSSWFIHDVTELAEFAMAVAIRHRHPTIRVRSLNGMELARLTA